MCNVMWAPPRLAPLLHPVGSGCSSAGRLSSLAPWHRFRHDNRTRNVVMCGVLLTCYSIAHSGFTQAQQLHAFATRECTDDVQSEAWRQICLTVARFIAADGCYKDRSESGAVHVFALSDTECESDSLH